MNRHINVVYRCRVVDWHINMHWDINVVNFVMIWNFSVVSRSYVMDRH